MHKKWLNMLPDYITNTLPDKQKSDLEEHLKGCAECREALEEWRIIADVTRMKADSLKSPLPPLLDVLNGTNHSHPNPQNEEFKGDYPMTTLRMPQQRKFAIPWTAAAVLLLTFFFSLLLLSGLNLQPTPLQQGETLVIPEDPIELFQLYIDEVWNKQNLDTIPLLLNENHVHHDATVQEDIIGLEAMADYISTEHKILPDVIFSTENLVMNNNDIIGRVTMRYEAFEKTVLVNASISNGKLLETWFDVETMVEAYNVDLMTRHFAMLYSGEVLKVSDLEPFEARIVSFHFPNGNHQQGITHGSSANFWNMNHASCTDWHGKHTFMPQRDLVVIQTLGTCDFDAPFTYWGAELEPTGNRIQNQFTWIMRIADGKVVEVWWYQNDPRFYGTIATLLENGSMDVDHQIEAIYKLNSNAVQQDAVEFTNMQTVRTVQNEVWNSENPDEAVLEHLFTDLYQAHEQDNKMIEGRISSPWIAAAKLGRAWREAYPDMQVSIDQISADGDYVTILMTFTGTYSGTSIDLGLTEPDNRVHQWDGSATFRIEDGKLAEHWVYWDN